MYKHSTNLQQLLDWSDNPETAPDWSKNYLTEQKYWAFKRNPTVKPILFWEDVHHYAKDKATEIQSLIKEDIYLTGSWVNGTFCYPELTPEYSQIRANLGKPPISDLDFYIPELSIEVSRLKLWEISEKLDIKLDSVVWWGSGISVRTHDVIACNPQNKIGPQVRRKYTEHYSLETLSRFKIFNRERQ